MKIIKLTHNNAKRPVYVQVELMDAWYYDTTTKSTLIFLSKGNMLPVAETCEEVLALAINPNGADTDVIK